MRWWHQTASYEWASSSRDGTSVEGFSPDDCRPIKGDGIAMPVRWQDGRDIRALAHADVRLDFRLRNAKLYSFRGERLSHPRRLDSLA